MVGSRRFITIDRSVWMTGQALTHARYSGKLLDARSGLADVIGQYLLEIGVASRHLENQSMVGGLTCELPQEAQWLLSAPGIESAAAEAIQATNDGALHQIRKEAKLQRLFNAQGITVQFVGNYRSASTRARQAFAQAA